MVPSSRPAPVSSANPHSCPRPRRADQLPRQHPYTLPIPSSTLAAILSKTPALSHRAILRRNSPDTPSRSVCTTSPTDLTSVCSRNWQTDADSPNAEADHPSSGPGFCPGNRPPSPAVYLMEDRRRQDRVRVVHLCHLGGFGRE